MLEGQHRRIEKSLRELADPKSLDDMRWFRDAFLTLAARLSRLFDVEERLAFARFEEETGLRSVGPTWNLRREHREIERRIERVWSMLTTSPAVDLLPQLQAFDALVSDHLRREGTLLRDVLDLMLDEAARSEMARILLQDVHGRRGALRRAGPTLAGAEVTEESSEGP